MTCTPTTYNCYNVFNNNFSRTNPDINNINTVCNKNYPLFVESYTCTDPVSSSSGGLSSDQFNAFMTFDVILLLCIGLLIGVFSFR